jgi:hypothetical protein
MLTYDELLLLEAVLCFHTRASTSADLRARFDDLWERVSRVRIAASSPQRMCSRSAHAGDHAGASLRPTSVERSGD